MFVDSKTPTYWRFRLTMYGGVCSSSIYLFVCLHFIYLLVFTLVSLLMKIINETSVKVIIKHSGPTFRSCTCLGVGTRPGLPLQVSPWTDRYTTLGVDRHLYSGPVLTEYRSVNWPVKPCPTGPLDPHSIRPFTPRSWRFFLQTVTQSLQRFGIRSRHDYIEFPLVTVPVSSKNEYYEDRVMIEGSIMYVISK